MYHVISFICDIDDLRSFFFNNDCSFLFFTIPSISNYVILAVSHRLRINYVQKRVIVSCFTKISFINGMENIN